MLHDLPKKQHLIRQRRVSRENDSLKKLIWVYFLFLIFEGALRKWFLPFLSTPLLVIRDPIAVIILISAYQKKAFIPNTYVITLWIIGVIGIMTALFFGHGNLAVAIYGARIMLFHFPLIFIIGNIFDRRDVMKIGKATLWIAIPMSLLLALQFYSPQSAWVNRGLAGNEEGAGFGGALGFYRPPGTFSFITGTTLFYSFLAPFVFYFWLNPSRYIPRFLLLGATFSLLAAIPLSISRGLFFQVMISVIFALATISRRPQLIGRLIASVIIIVVAFGIVSLTSFFDTASTAFMHRFETANEQEGGVENVLIDRFLGGLIGAISDSTDQPFFGHGLGMGTNVGSMLLRGDMVFLIAEGEWGRSIGELGPLLGLAVVMARLTLSIELSIKSYGRLIKGDLLPWMLLSFGAITISQGGWGQATALGFFVMIGGLQIASLKPAKKRLSYASGKSIAKNRRSKLQLPHSGPLPPAPLKDR